MNFVVKIGASTHIHIRMAICLRLSFPGLYWYFYDCRSVTNQTEKTVNLVEFNRSLYTTNRLLCTNKYTIHMYTHT